MVLDFPSWQNVFLGNIQKSSGSAVQMKAIANHNLGLLWGAALWCPCYRMPLSVMEMCLCMLAFQNVLVCFCYWWAVCLACRLFICGVKFGNNHWNTQTFSHMLGLGARLTCWFTDNFAKYLIQTMKAIWFLRSSRPKCKNSTPFFSVFKPSLSICLRGWPYCSSFSKWVLSLLSILPFFFVKGMSCCCFLCNLRVLFFSPDVFSYLPFVIRDITMK